MHRICCHIEFWNTSLKISVVLGKVASHFKVCLQLNEAYFRAQFPSLSRFVDWRWGEGWIVLCEWLASLHAQLHLHQQRARMPFKQMERTCMHSPTACISGDALACSSAPSMAQFWMVYGPVVGYSPGLGDLSFKEYHAETQHRYSRYCLLTKSLLYIEVFMQYEDITERYIPNLYKCLYLRTVFHPSNRMEWDDMLVHLAFASMDNH